MKVETTLNKQKSHLTNKLLGTSDLKNEFHENDHAVPERLTKQVCNITYMP
jgi:hypothetical protein